MAKLYVNNLTGSEIQMTFYALLNTNIKLYWVECKV